MGKSSLVLALVVLMCMGITAQVPSQKSAYELKHSLFAELNPIPQGRLKKGDLPCDGHAIAYDLNGTRYVALFPKDVQFVLAALGHQIGTMQTEVSFPASRFASNSNSEPEPRLEILATSPNYPEVTLAFRGFSENGLIACRAIRLK